MNELPQEVSLWQLALQQAYMLGTLGVSVWLKSTSNWTVLPQSSRMRVICSYTELLN